MLPLVLRVSALESFVLGIPSPPFSITAEYTCLPAMTPKLLFIVGPVIILASPCLELPNVRKAPSVRLILT